MQKSRKCPQCGSAEVIPSARVMAQGDMAVRHDVEIRTEADPAAVLFSEPAYARLAASVCCECGHVELFVPDTVRLRMAWEKAKERADQPT